MSGVVDSGRKSGHGNTDANDPKRMSERVDSLDAWQAASGCSVHSRLKIASNKRLLLADASGELSVRDHSLRK